MVELLGAERGLLLLFAEDGMRLEVAAQSSMDSATVKDATALSKGVVNEAAGKGIPIICDDAFTDPRFNQNRSVVLNNIHSLLCVPLKLREQVLGTLYVDSRLDRRLFSKDDVPFVGTLASMMAVAIDSARYHERILRENVQLKSEVLGKYGPGSMIGRSEGMQKVFGEIQQVAGTDSTVLILGETGTGKELVARAIHYQGKRVGKMFLTIDCGALPESLLESELFGHKKGSFTGAVSDKKGLFEVGEGGTIFLDEIGDAPQSVQSRLLRVLERSEVRRIGESQYRKVNVRMVCATNKNLAAEVEAGRFRKDLYFRLNVLNIGLPPLRERREDIILLANYFVDRMKDELGKRIEGISPDAERTLIAYPWPGNVRELQNEVARACTLVPKSCSISSLDLSPVVRGESRLGDERLSLDFIIRGTEKRIIVESLARNGWNRSRTAAELGVSRQGLLKKMHRYGISGKKSTQ
jgi:Nif-specific regulatory protein